MERSLIYVSRRSSAIIDPDKSIADMVAGARTRNAALKVTGALVSTDEFFAQLLEGRLEAVDDLMHSIEKDTRHTDILVVESTPIFHRQFPDWTLAYHGASAYVAGQIDAVYQRPRATWPMRAARLRVLMVGLSRSPQPD